MTLNRGINKLMDAREGTKLSISVSSGTKGKYPGGSGFQHKYCAVIQHVYL